MLPESNCLKQTLYAKGSWEHLQHREEEERNRVTFNDIQLGRGH